MLFGQAFLVLVPLSGIINGIVNRLFQSLSNYKLLFLLFSSCGDGICCAFHNLLKALLKLILCLMCLLTLAKILNVTFGQN